MKKLRTLSNLWVTDIRKITGVLIIALGLGFGFWSVTADNDKDKDHGNSNSDSSDKHGDQDKGDDKHHGKGNGDDKDHGNGNGNGNGNGADKCIVCHNDHNFHEISIPCDQVAKYLEHHPGDHAGPCNVTSVTNP